MNEDIRANEVRVLGENKDPLGVMSKSEALAMANSAGLDLILVVADADPPVCRLIEYSKYNYEKTKAEKDAKKKQRESMYVFVSKSMLSTFQCTVVYRQLPGASHK